MCFVVRHAGIHIKVRLLESALAVHYEHQAGCARVRNGEWVCGFFAPARSARAKHTGTIVLGVCSKLSEYIPHEVTHAVLHHMRSVDASDDEDFAYAVGILSAKIGKKITKRGFQ
jgi:hypothetical protein